MEVSQVGTLEAHERDAMPPNPLIFGASHLFQSRSHFCSLCCWGLLQKISGSLTALWAFVDPEQGVLSVQGSQDLGNWSQDSPPLPPSLPCRAPP